MARFFIEPQQQKNHIPQLGEKSQRDLPSDEGWRQQAPLLGDTRALAAKTAVRFRGDGVHNGIGNLQG